MAKSLENAIQTEPELFVRQRKEWAEIIIDFETSNRYAVMDRNKEDLGMIAEEGGGLGAAIKRFIFRSHRALSVNVVEADGRTILRLSRKFFFFFSDLFVNDAGGTLVGAIHRRFGIIYKKYDLKDAQGHVFARISSPIWRLWTFPVIEAVSNQPQGDISKKWGGALREVFTDADTFRVSFGTHPWTQAQRAVIFAASISIDFDFFEENQGSSGLLDSLPG